MGRSLEAKERRKHKWVKACVGMTESENKANNSRIGQEEEINLQNKDFQIDVRSMNEDWTLKGNGTTRHYWYSAEDMRIVLNYLRSQYLNYVIPEWLDGNIDMGDLYSAYRINEQRIFLAEPYSEDNFENSIMYDFSRIYNEWGEAFPNQFIFVLIAQAHWRVVRIIFDNLNETIDILWDDPYGGYTFPQNLKDTILTLIREIFYFFKHVEVPISEVTKQTDQQGLGSNGWDCGPISIQNVEDYLINHSMNNIDVDNYFLSDNHFINRNRILDIRKRHIIISMGGVYSGQEIVFEMSQGSQDENASNSTSNHDNDLRNMKSSSNEVDDINSGVYGNLECKIIFVITGGWLQSMFEV